MTGDEGYSPASDDATLTEALTTLKRRGSNLLVVGAITGDATSRACARMLGDADPTDRHRLLVFTDADDRRASERLPGADGHHSGRAVTLIDHEAASRSAVAAGQSVGETGTTETPGAPSLSGGLPDGVDSTEIDATDLVELGTAVTETIDDIAADAGGLAASELRVCLDSLLPLLEANGEEAVFRFLHLLTGHIRQHRGMAHFHLPVDASEEVVHVLTPLFDAVVELRTQNGATQQRWHVQDADVSTDWLTV